MTGNIPGELGTAAEYLHLILDNFLYTYSRRSSHPLLRSREASITA
jgi:hypothetical protein